MSTIVTQPFLLHCSLRQRSASYVYAYSKRATAVYCNCSGSSLPGGLRLNSQSWVSRRALTPRASNSTDTAFVETADQSSDVGFRETFNLKRPVKVEGKIAIRLLNGKDEKNWRLCVGCSLPGKWVLHWGVNYIDDVGSEWDQPSPEMIPRGSLPIKDYAI